MGNYKAGESFGRVADPNSMSLQRAVPEIQESKRERPQRLVPFGIPLVIRFDGSDEPIEDVRHGSHHAAPVGDHRDA